MNAAEQMALLELVEAATPHAKRKALGLLLGRGVRLEQATRGRLQAALRAPSMSAVPTTITSVPGADILAPGPMPVLPAEAVERISFWASCWEQVERFDDDERPGPLLLCGPPGTGKTMTTRWMAGLLQERYPAFVLDTHRWVSSGLGESSRQLGKAFQALSARTGLLVLEEVDTVGAMRGYDGQAASGEMARVTVGLMRLVEPRHFPVVATTNRAGELDEALVRRFDEVIELPEPCDATKRRIVQGVLKGAPFDFGAWAGLPLVDQVRAARDARRRFVLEHKEGSG